MMYEGIPYHTTRTCFIVCDVDTCDTCDGWSPEQALAVVELLDDLREVIWARYQLPLQELLREQRCARFCGSEVLFVRHNSY